MSNQFNLHAESVQGTVILTWDVPIGIAEIIGYNVYRSTDNQNFSIVNTSIISETTYSDNTVTNGIEYFYYVTAIDQDLAESKASNTFVIVPFDPPEPPINVEITAGDQKVELGWDPGNLGTFALQGYKIFRRTRFNTFVQVNEEIIPIDTEEFINLGLINDVEYFFTIRAVDEKGNESQDSIIVHAIPQVIPILWGPPMQITFYTDNLLNFHDSVQQKINDKIVVNQIHKDNSIDTLYTQDFLFFIEDFHDSFNKKRKILENVTSLSSINNKFKGVLATVYTNPGSDQEIYFALDDLEFAERFNWTNIVQLTNFEDNHNVLHDSSANDNLFITFNSSPLLGAEDFQLLQTLGFPKKEKNSFALNSSIDALESLVSETEVDFNANNFFIDQSRVIEDKNVDSLSLKYLPLEQKSIFIWSSSKQGYNITLRARKFGNVIIELQDLKKAETLGPVENAVIFLEKDHFENNKVRVSEDIFSIEKISGFNINFKEIENLSPFIQSFHSKTIEFNKTIFEINPDIFSISVTYLFLKDGFPKSKTEIAERYIIERTAKTDKDGIAFLAGVLPNLEETLFYRIRIVHPEYPTVRLIVFINDDISVYPQQFSSIAGTDKEIKVNFLGGSIFGNVRDAFSSFPIENSTINIENENTQKSLNEFTDSNGKYEIIDLNPANYNLSAYKLRFHLQNVNFQIVENEEYLFNFDLVGDPASCGETILKEMLNFITPSYWNTEERFQNYMFFLEAYAEEFCKIYDILDKVVDNFYIQTADVESLNNNWGHVLGIKPIGDIEVYRFIIQSFLKVIRFGGTIGNIYHAIGLILESERKLSEKLVKDLGFQLGESPEDFLFEYGETITEIADIVNEQNIKVSHRPISILNIWQYDSEEDANNDIDRTVGISINHGGIDNFKIIYSNQQCCGSSINLEEELDLKTSSVIVVQYRYFSIITFAQYDKSDEKLLNKRVAKYNDAFSPEAIPEKRISHSLMIAQTQYYEMIITLPIDYDFTFNGLRKGRKSLHKFVQELNFIARILTPAHVKSNIKIKFKQKEDFPISRVASSIKIEGAIKTQIDIIDESNIPGVGQ